MMNCNLLCARNAQCQIPTDKTVIGVVVGGLFVGEPLVRKLLIWAGEEEMETVGGRVP